MLRFVLVSFSLHTGLNRFGFHRFRFAVFDSVAPNHDWEPTTALAFGRANEEVSPPLAGVRPSRMLRGGNTNYL